MGLILSVVLTTVSFGQAVVQPQCFEAIGIRSVTDANPELTGEGVTVGIVELSEPRSDQPNAIAFLPNLDHAALSKADWGGYYFNDDLARPMTYSDHASMIAAILAGKDNHGRLGPLGDFRYQGIAPKAKLNVYETYWFLYKRVLTLQEPSAGDDVLTLSWGTDADDQITNWWQQGIDALVERDNCFVAAGCGNGPGETDSITKPAEGYNVVAVGTARGLGDWPDYLQYVGWSEPGHTGCGPTNDGRAKPDLIAPGAVIGPSGLSADGYCLAADVSGCSSFAAPEVAGVAALLIQAARRESFENGDDPRLIKAVLLNGADKLEGWHHGDAGAADDHRVPLDYLQGAGLLNAENSYRQLMAGDYPADLPTFNTGWDVNTVAIDVSDPNSERVYYPITALAKGDVFKATLCWYRHYGSDRLYTPEALTDLVLELWQTDEQGNLLRLLDYSDSKKDNLEHVYYRSAVTQYVALVVRSATPDQDADEETYALAWTSEEVNWPGDRLRGDLNADGVVNKYDLEQVIRVWLFNEAGGPQKPGYCPPEDLNLDGVVNADDISILMRQWQQQSDWYNSQSTAF